MEPPTEAPSMLDKRNWRSASHKAVTVTGISLKFLDIAPSLHHEFVLGIYFGHVRKKKNMATAKAPSITPAYRPMFRPSRKPFA
jgi:hypothetical protein